MARSRPEVFRAVLTIDVGCGNVKTVKFTAQDEARVLGRALLEINFAREQRIAHGVFTYPGYNLEFEVK